MATIDKEYYRNKLIEYLKSTKYLRNADEQKVQKFVDAIEVDLLVVIRSNQHVNLQEVYEYTDTPAEPGMAPAAESHDKLEGAILQDTVS